MSTEDEKDTDPSIETTDALDDTHGHSADGSDDDDDADDTDRHRLIARNVGVSFD